MPFVPSLLEYSPRDLQVKLELIKNNLNAFNQIQAGVNDKIYLHLDFVLPEFATSRNVQPGNSPKVVFDLIDDYFQGQKVVCNSHFMGSKADTQIVLEFFQNYNWNPNWEYILYVGKEFVNEFESVLPYSPSQIGYQPLNKGQLPVQVSNLKIGMWLDLDQYDYKTKFELHDYLLMTVFAGKSGQKLTDKVRLNTLKIIQNNPEVAFTVDGGWTVVDDLKELGLEQKNILNVVSYSSFWNEFEKII